jgi:hypothetical protein
MLPNEKVVLHGHWPSLGLWDIYIPTIALIDTERPANFWSGHSKMRRRRKKKKRRRNSRICKKRDCPVGRRTLVF